MLLLAVVCVLAAGVGVMLARVAWVATLKDLARRETSAVLAAVVAVAVVAGLCVWFDVAAFWVGWVLVAAAVGFAADRLIVAVRYSRQAAAARARMERPRR